MYSSGLKAAAPRAIQGEAQIKQAYVDGYLTDAEFEAQIDKVVRGEQSMFFLGDRQPDPLFGPDLITDPKIPSGDEPGRAFAYTPVGDPKSPEDAEPGDWEQG